MKITTSKKRFGEASELLQVVQELVCVFQKYRKITQIATLCDQAVAFQSDLKKQIFTEFELAVLSGSIKAQSRFLLDACILAEILGPDIKKQLIDWYCEFQLKDYRTIFRTNPELAGLDNVSRRFAWLKRVKKQYDDEHISAFPPSWNLARIFCERFCNDTRKDMNEVLEKLESFATTGNEVDVKQLIQAITATIEFETKLNSQFNIIVNEDGTIQENNEEGSSDDVHSSQGIKLAPSFLKLISGEFEPHLHHYVVLEDKNLSDLIQGYKDRGVIIEEDGVLSSSMDLFYFYRQSLVNFSKLSTHKPFLELSQLFGKWLKEYSLFMISRLPK